MRRLTVGSWVLLLGLSGGVSGCGLDGLFLTSRGFDPTPPPRSVLVGQTTAGASLQVMSADGRVVATAVAPNAGEFRVELPPEEEGTNLRLLVRGGTRTFKRVIPRAPQGEITDVGPVDARSTAIAQLATYEVTAEAGSTFPATPPTALEGLITEMTNAGTPALVNFQTIVEGLLARDVPGDFGAFNLVDWTLEEAYVVNAGLGADALVEYRLAIAAAASDYGLQIRCDPSRLNVMFTVDASGRGRDGNGTPQLIRQPTKEGKVFLGFTADESSSVSDEAIPRRLSPNDPTYVMLDNGQGGDEVAQDGVYTVVVPLPRGARLQYKYTNGSAGEGFTGTEEWPGNARIIEIEDVLTGRPDGEPDCLVIRRDSFGDEASNKNFVNLNGTARERGGTVAFDTDLGGGEAPSGRGNVRLGGLLLNDLRGTPPLTPRGVPEARENGVCEICPAPLILDPNDRVVPRLLSAERLRIDSVRLRFSEPILREDAVDVGRYLYLDSAGQSVEVLRATPSGSDILLEVEPTHPTESARLKVRDLRDVSSNENTLSEATVIVEPDTTAPRVASVRALSIQDIEPGAPVADPTVGEIVEVVFDEMPETSAAGDPSRYSIDGLNVLAATLVADAPAPTVRLVTEVQTKGAGYVLTVRGVRDPAANALEQELPFDGFALYKARFAVVPGFAFASSDGTVRGLPRGEKLYLTGTPLAAARDLSGRSLSILEQGGSRTDVTGWPQFELTPSADIHAGEPIYTIEVLLPPGSWAYKAAHGVEGEYVRAPPTLEKVYKVLATANDATGVRVDPVTLQAANGLDYRGARLSESGDDPPRSDVVFKREAPDEVCEVVNRDVDCPFIVVGTWRDLVLDQGGRTRDYDDGIVTLDPHRPSLPDVAPPKLLDARARDSFSILMSFDETLLSPHTTLKVELSNADTGIGLEVRVIETNEVRPHQTVLLLSSPMELGTAYTVRYRGASDVQSPARVDRTFRTTTVLAPDVLTPLRPLTDIRAPAVVSVSATDLTELVVTFDEVLDPMSVTDPAQFSIVQTMSGSQLAVVTTELLADKQSLRLETERQQILQPYSLTLEGVADISDPPNVLTSSTVSFVGFGERVPPQVERVRAVAADAVLVRFDEPVESVSALDSSRYSIAGLNIRNVQFSGDPARRRLAFNPRLAPRQRDSVLLETSPMTEGTTYNLVVNGVVDLSGNTATASVAFAGVSSSPTVDVIIEYDVSDAKKVAGRVPSRAISVATLSDAREGLFILGARAEVSNAPAPGNEGPGNSALGGFPPDGQPLDGIEPRLRDDGAIPDRNAGDGVFSILVPDVPLGTTLIWKAFASYKTEFRDRNPTDSAAAFADGIPGPAVYADGQEYPGNENGAIIYDEGTTPGEVRIRCLYGDEVSYKKNTDGPAFIWVVGDR